MIVSIVRSTFVIAAFFGFNAEAQLFSTSRWLDSLSRQNGGSGSVGCDKVHHRTSNATTGKVPPLQSSQSPKMDAALLRDAERVLNHFRMKPGDPPDDIEAFAVSEYLRLYTLGGIPFHKNFLNAALRMFFEYPDKFHREAHLVEKATVALLDEIEGNNQGQEEFGLILSAGLHGVDDEYYRTYFDDIAQALVRATQFSKEEALIKAVSAHLARVRRENDLRPETDRHRLVEFWNAYFRLGVEKVKAKHTDNADRFAEIFLTAAVVGQLDGAIEAAQEAVDANQPFSAVIIEKTVTAAVALSVAAKHEIKPPVFSRLKGTRETVGINTSLMSISEGQTELQEQVIDFLKRIRSQFAEGLRQH
ncbi:MAG: hypothetical protein C5B49_08655 [Bdellovibrio sp.]|nr:MAG: hypothetical protein C5B49_08655 [Bdellovibrio sp.]